MTRLLIGYDGSDAAGAAITAAGALFPQATGVVATVHPPPVTFETAAPARAALSDAAIAEGVHRLDEETLRGARQTAAEGVELAHDAGLHAEPVMLTGFSPWRALRAAAADAGADVLVCGARGENPLERTLLGSTAASLLHHADRPLLVVPTARAPLDGPVLAGFDESEGALDALRFAAEHCHDRRIVVAHAWRSPVRHSLRGHALVASHLDVLEDYAETLDKIWRELAEESAETGAECCAQPRARGALDRAGIRPGRVARAAARSPPRRRSGDPRRLSRPRRRGRDGPRLGHHGARARCRAPRARRSRPAASLAPARRGSAFAVRGS